MSIDFIIRYANDNQDGAHINGNLYELGPVISPLQNFLLNNNSKLRAKVFPYWFPEEPDSDNRNLEDPDLSELNADEFNLIYKLLKEGCADWPKKDITEERKIYIQKTYDELFTYMEEDNRFEK